jgi:tRNA A-37 threonylcarbamoyl transferase component Bud32
MAEKTTTDGVAHAHSFGRFRVTKTLGMGAMGEVYEAVDDVLGREVAIKTLPSASGITARFIDDRFRNEARAIAQFSHPGVVQVFDIDLGADPPYLVMERVTGPSLAERLRNGPLQSADIAPLGIQIARALAAAHAAGVVHRDVKPSNILAAGSGTWKLADFGVAHVPDSSLTMTGQFVGSPAYAAPEALVKGVSAAAGDVYGLGATLYEAAHGSWPRKEADGAILAPVQPLAQIAPNVPAHVAAAIDRAIAIDAAHRPTANQLADLLAGVACDAVAARAPRALRWQPWAIGGAIVLVIILVIALRGGDKRSAPPNLPAAAALPPWCELTDDGLITVHPPPNLTEKSAKDWEKIIKRVYEQDFDKAMRELERFEDKYGPRDETACLRAQLERLPADMHEGD